MQLERVLCMYPSLLLAVLCVLRMCFYSFVCMKFGIAVSGSDGEIEGKKSEMPTTK